MKEILWEKPVDVFSMGYDDKQNSIAIQFKSHSIIANTAPITVLEADNFFDIGNVFNRIGILKHVNHLHKVVFYNSRTDLINAFRKVFIKFEYHFFSFFKIVFP